MTLQAGARFGSYEIVGPIGAGGMGEVYRARDARLGRDAAIKILPDAFLNDADRVARFEREARTLASLNHPNIAQIYGMEDATAPSTGRALVMELVEGEDLSVILARGPVALHDALPMARQIASALEAAHELGIVHRDLKPANVKVRPDGTVKVLDFGLARSGGPGADGSGAALSNSPTMTSPATEFGMILGTAAYMSPEQARGKVVDKRADVWAFGVVLYEMLSGRRAFEGGEVSDVLASVLKDTVPIQQVPAGTPAPIRRLLRRCLEKDRADRLDSMATARLEIADAMAARNDGVATSASAGSAKRGPSAVLVAALSVAAAAGAVAAFFAWRALHPPPGVPTAFALTPPGGGALRINVNQPDLAISPDGRRMAYSHGELDSTIIVRTLDGFSESALTGLGEQPRSPFFSPNSKWLGYFSAASSGLGARLMKVPLDGGGAVQIATVTGNLRGATWGRDDTIIFATHTFATGLWRVSASGGTPEMLTTANETAGEIDHLWPHLMPDGKHVLFTIVRRRNDALRLEARDVAALDLGTRTWKVVKSGASYPKFVSTGHLLYATAQGLFATKFDAATCELRGEPVRVVESVAFKPASGGADIDVSDTGTLLFIAGASQDRSTFAWVDRRGVLSPIAAPPHIYQTVYFSPDLKRVAVIVTDDGRPALWVYDLAREILGRLSPPGETGSSAVWSADGRDIFYDGTLNGKAGVLRVSAAGAGAPEFVLEETPSGLSVAPSGLTPDGRSMVVTRAAADGAQDIAMLSLNGTPALTPLLAERDRISQGRISPDGRWLAYVSTVNTISEVFLRPYPNVKDDRIQVSTDGGLFPVWAPDSRTLFYRLGGIGGIWSVDVGGSGGRHVGKPVRLTAPDAAASSTDSATGTERILRVQRVVESGKSNELRVVLNWFETLKQKVKGN